MRALNRGGGQLNHHTSFHEGQQNIYSRFIQKAGELRRINEKFQFIFRKNKSIHQVGGTPTPFSNQSRYYQ